MRKADHYSRFAPSTVNFACLSGVNGSRTNAGSSCKRYFNHYVLQLIFVFKHTYVQNLFPSSSHHSRTLSREDHETLACIKGDMWIRQFSPA